VGDHISVLSNEFFKFLSIKKKELVYIIIMYIIWRKDMKNRMKRTNIFLTQKQHSKVLKEAENRGITFSEMFRKIVDYYLEKGK